MTDPLAINTDKSALDEAEVLVSTSASMPLSTRKPRHVRIARQVSNILAPATISVPMVLLVAFYKTSSSASAFAYAGLTLFFLSIGPFTYIFIGVRLGKFSDIDVSKRTERVGPFIFGLISVCLGWFALVLTHGPTPLISTIIVTAISGLVMMIITLKWKISLHSGSLATAATILTVLYGAIMLPAFVLLILVSWSRVVLRRHTLAQVVAGSLLSITLSALILKLIGW
ncbi:MAG TPA: phosphatase PAP2 family protein [Ktedonobacteraceae bacterium]|nr:phosphatase PAP2 family protein [Ktedonobacteraceae bacterium]